ncbi:MULTISPECIES: flagellin N-terminal helical domain-containing protein [Xanthobacter]|uniref:flagellin N-terminal helical domain-containing protein n=1 Tax=Xanthobacter TaxID=279 RepID=UPI001F306ACF|nr:MULTISPECIES: flagellin [unclassified Xanthobacter]
MTSIITNNSATVALQTLRSINNDLEMTNNRVSTGKKINDASDSASYWTIATTLTSDNSALSSVTDAMALDSNAVTTASKGVTQVIEDLKTIKDALAASISSNADRGAAQKNITAAIENIKTAATSSISGSAGDNWLSVDSQNDSEFTESKSLLASFSRTGSTVNVTTTSLDTGEFRLYDKSGSATTSGTVYDTVTDIATDSSFTDDLGNAFTVSITSGETVKGFMDTTYSLDYVDASSTAQTATISLQTIDVSSLTDDQTNLISAYMKLVDKTITSLTSGGATLGATADRLESQQTFATSLIDLNKSSIGTLVDADMEEESTRLKALQTQQSLAIQSLSIANSSSSNVLRLFQ